VRISVRLGRWKNTVSVITRLPENGICAKSSAHAPGAVSPKSASNATAMLCAAARSRTPVLAHAVACG